MGNGIEAKDDMKEKVLGKKSEGANRLNPQIKHAETPLLHNVLDARPSQLVTRAFRRRLVQQLAHLEYVVHGAAVRMLLLCGDVVWVDVRHGGVSD
jgi:hypothetical protein